MRGFVFWSCPLGLLLCAALASCRTVQSVTPATLPASCTTALVPHSGDEKLDREIARLQQEVRAAERSRELFVPKLEQLGWKFVEKARLTYDAGYYKLAEACAQCIEARAASAQPSPQSASASSSASSTAVASVPASPTPSSPVISAEALLLRGHVLHNLHRFKEAEVIARQLVAQRGLAFDYGLLGDVLLEQGKLDEAIAAYQQMMNLKPGLQAYTRAAYVRWLQGDLPGALALMQLAVRASSPQQGEATAWAWTRLAFYELQAGNRAGARRAIEAALNYQADYAPALLARGRLLLAEENLPAALDSLRLAVKLNPTIEAQWTLADALAAQGLREEARQLEERLLREGRTVDPRTLALYLTTPRESRQPDWAATALKLAGSELEVRADVFTYDALAWAQAAAGHPSEAYTTMQRALAAGTADARLFYHAGAIAAMSGHRVEARRWLRQARALQQLLLPSEKADLQRYLRMLSG